MTVLEASEVEAARRWLRTEPARSASFRSEKLRPIDKLLINPLRYAEEMGDSGIAARVEELQRIRSTILCQLGDEQQSPVEELPGRLLVSSILESVVDCASSAASNGWFDDADLPPWDTWLYYGPVFVTRSPYVDALVSYVPHAHVDQVQGGINANPVGCHSWITSVQETMLERVFVSGSLG